jgi:hypothetical protein
VNLTSVHQILIASAIVLAAIFAVRSALLFAHGGGTLALGLALGAAALAVALGFYLRAFRRKPAAKP